MQSCDWGHDHPANDWSLADCQAAATAQRRSNTMAYDPYAHESSGDAETTQDQIYLRHIRQELQRVTEALMPLAVLADTLVALRDISETLASIDERLGAGRP